MADTDTPVTPPVVTPEPAPVVTPPVVEESAQEETMDSPIETPIFEENVYLPLAKETITVKKLKAGKYYKAQQLSLMYLRSLADMEVVKGKTLKGVMDEDGNPDLVKLEDKLKKERPSYSREQADKIMAAMDESETIKMQLLQICLDVQDIGDKYYAEDAGLLLASVIKVNGFWNNLKKSAPRTNTGSPTSL